MSAASLIGAVVTHYRIVAEIGRGGMGVVYRAEDTRLGRPVAVKFLPQDGLAAPGARERFLREAQAASALDHPNICTIHDVGEHQGRPFIVMALLEGQTLRDRLAHKLPLDDALGLAIQIVDGLAAAHAKGIVHRDIKPANIFVTSRGEVKLLDFGLARLYSPTDPDNLSDAGMATTQARPVDLTTPGEAIGTAPYMSPEQARGEPLDARSDLFSTGAVLYELFTGRRAFAGDSMADVFASLLERTPPSVRDLDHDMPALLDAVVTKALEKNRNLRYQSAADLRADLERARRDRSSGSAPAVGTHLPVRRSIGPRAALIAAALAAATTVWCVVLRRIGRPSIPSRCCRLSTPAATPTAST